MITFSIHADSFFYGFTAGMLLASGIYNFLGGEK